MDANKEQSERCIDIAIRCLNEGDREKALKFLHKAKRLNPTDMAADDFIRKLMQENGTPTQNGSATTNGDYNPFEADEMFTRSRFSSSKSNPDLPKHQENSSSGGGGHSGRAKNKNNTNNQSSSNDHKANTPSSSKDERSKFTSHNNSSSNKDRSKSRNRRSSTSSAGGGPQQRCTSQPQLGVDYTQEQLDMVTRVRRSKDYYEILNVSKEFVEIDLKKQYRKLALQFHPDKNRAPGATEAFKAIGNAYAVLSDPKKRERYDMYGTSDTSHVASRHHHHRDTYYEYDYSRGFEADMTAEEIFNMFFGGGFPQGNLRRRHNGHAQHSADAERRTETGFGVLLQLMPILILILLSIFSQLLVSDPPFSLKYTQKYTEERQTPELKVTYYVKPDFMKNYHGQIHRIEQQVDEEYIDNLRTMCFKEKNQRETLFWQARLYGDQKLYERAQQLPLHSCVRLSNIYK